MESVSLMENHRAVSVLLLLCFSLACPIGFVARVTEYINKVIS